MRGRSNNRTNKEAEGAPGSGSTSELSALLDAGSRSAKRQPLLRTSSLKLPNKKLYTVSESTQEEPALPSSGLNHHASKLMANRQRSSAASVLYHNLKNKRNAGSIAVKESRNAMPFMGESGVHTGQRPSLNVYVQEKRNADQTAHSYRSSHNPINHYQFSRNITTRPKSSSTTHIPTLTSFQRANSGARDLSMSVELKLRGLDAEAGLAADRPAAVDFKSTGDFFPQTRHNWPPDVVVGQERLEVDEDSENRLLETQIESAINEDLFPREYVFDNKFDDIIEGPKDSHNADVPSISSSNQSPLTRIPARRLSKADFTSLEEFQKDISKGVASFPSDSSHPSRLQMKMDVLKSRFDSFTTDHRPSAGTEAGLLLVKGENSSHGSDQSGLFTMPGARRSTFELESEGSKSSDIGASGLKTHLCKFWFRNDLQTKLLTERLSNQLRTIERFPSSGSVGEKILVSRIRGLSKNQSCISDPSQLRWQHRTAERAVAQSPPIQLRSEKKDINFEELFNSAKGLGPKGDLKNHSSDDDTEIVQLENKMKLGRTVFDELWMDSEQSELLALAVSLIADSKPALSASPIYLHTARTSSFSDPSSSDGTSFPVSPEEMRHPGSLKEGQVT